MTTSLVRAVEAEGVLSEAVSDRVASAGRFGVKTIVHLRSYSTRSIRHRLSDDTLCSYLAHSTISLRCQGDDAGLDSGAGSSIGSPISVSQD